MSLPTVVVVGGGLSGLSAAHTALDAGCRVVVLDKMAFLGGNSTKATSGLNGAGTRTQKARGIPDTKEIFEEDTIRSATGQKTGPCPPSYALGRVLTWNSGDSVHWVQDKFGLKLDVVSRLGGHSHPRTHRSGGSTQFPGMEITYRLMQRFEEISTTEPSRAKIVNRANVNKILTDGSGAVIGVEYEKEGKKFTEHGAVVIATGGYGAGNLSKGSLLEKYRPDLMHLPTTNGIHCTGDGIVIAQAVGAATVDLDYVQVHPTGLVHLDAPEERVKFLAAEALRGNGAIILDKNGKRFCDELGTRDYVSGMLFKNQGPFRLVLNKAASNSILWHCKHYTGRRVMKHYAKGAELAKDIGVDPKVLNEEFEKYNGYAKNKNDPFGRKFFEGVPYGVEDEFYAAIITPVIHYCMGGLQINEKAEVLKADGSKAALPGLFAAGEVTGGVHGKNRLGGSALLECVVYGRVAGDSVSKYAKAHPVKAAAAGGSGALVTVTVKQADGRTVTVTVGGDGAISSGGAASSSSDISAHPDAAEAKAAAPAAAGKPALKQYTLEEVAKHKSEKDCWVVVNGQVIDATSFLDDHPGGKMAIMTFAGRDATEEFNMVHDKNVIEKYAANLVVGTLAPKAKL